MRFLDRVRVINYINNIRTNTVKIALVLSIFALFTVSSLAYGDHNFASAKLYLQNGDILNAAKYFAESDDPNGKKLSLSLLRLILYRYSGVKIDLNNIDINEAEGVEQIVKAFQVLAKKENVAILISIFKKKIKLKISIKKQTRMIPIELPKESVMDDQFQYLGTITESRVFVDEIKKLKSMIGISDENDGMITLLVAKLSIAILKLDTYEGYKGEMELIADNEDIRNINTRDPDLFFNPTIVPLTYLEFALFLKNRDENGDLKKANELLTKLV